MTAAFERPPFAGTLSTYFLGDALAQGARDVGQHSPTRGVFSVGVNAAKGAGHGYRAPRSIE
jgi:hypothetical protein